MGLNGAYGVLSELEAGRIMLTLPMTGDYAEAISLLATDLLLKNIAVTRLSKADLDLLLDEIFAANSVWNRRLQTDLNQAYTLADKHQVNDAVMVLSLFTADCPSQFYSEIASGVRDQILER